MTFFYFILHLMCLSNLHNNLHENLHNNLHENLNQYSITLKNKVDTKGMDQHPFVDNTNLDLISTNMHKKRILDTLISPNVATLEKIKIINNYDILNIENNSILNGGLLDDFNFDIEL